MSGRYLVTGATSGVGMAVAHALLAAHAVDCVGRDADKLGRVYESLSGASVRLVDFEQAEPILVTAMVKAWVAEHGEGFDGIFHAAGAELVLPLRLMGDGLYRRAMSFADSSFALLRAAATQGVVKPGGSVVIMSSVAAHRGTAGMAAYSAARAAVEGMARVAAVELAARRVRVNCVAAGAFRSPMHERLTKRMPKTAQDAYTAAHPLGVGDVDAVRDSVLHLLSDAARWTTGTVQVVDGGYLAA